MSRIDWEKPIEFMSSGEWCPARLIADNVRAVNCNVLAYRSQFDREELCVRVDREGKYYGESRVRNVPQNTKHIVITYRTKAGKLTASVQEGSMKNPSGKKYSVGEEFNNCKILHIAEFEIAA